MFLTGTIDSTGMCSLTRQADVDIPSLILYQNLNADAEQAEAALYAPMWQQRFAYAQA